MALLLSRLFLLSVVCGVVAVNGDLGPVVRGMLIMSALIGLGGPCLQVYSKDM